MATFIQLTDFKSSEEKERQFFNEKNIFIVKGQDNFSKIPGSPIAYWVLNYLIEIFSKSYPLSHYASSRIGLSTGNNDRYLRYWFEIDNNNLFLNDCTTIREKTKWFKYDKGGLSRKWYGNKEYVVYWLNDGKEIRNDSKSVIRNPTYYFKYSVQWNRIGHDKLAARYSNNESIFDVNSASLFNDENLYYFLAFLNSKVNHLFMKIFSPTLTFQVGDVSKTPIIFDVINKNIINSLTQQNINISREEWDSRETSWDFRKNELLRCKTSGRLKDAYDSYCSYWKEQFFKLHANEEELNRIFIDIYDLADEMTPNMPLEDITILKEESEIKGDELVFKKEIIVKQFISYSVGCMFGRYSPDKKGLILANKGETIKDFTAKVPAPSFMPDDDNIIPVLEDEYFKDDIVSRFKEFLKITFGAESLAENLDFIAGALLKSKKGDESSENIIRDYFLKSFFKDHARTYQKRPIYWLFTSGKGRGFNALVYMHRYDKTLLAKMRTDYLLAFEDKIDAKIAMLSSESDRDKQDKVRLGKLMQELQAYDEKLNNKALAFIDIDLDDGVTVNYGKFEGLVEGI